MLGVTGPNEYENNINNNWYTNRMASWTLQWTLEAHNWLERKCCGRAQRYREQNDSKRGEGVR